MKSTVQTAHTDILHPVLKKLYGDDEKTLQRQMKRYGNLAKTFEQHFAPPEAELQWFSTPGRSEIGGNHTDHNHGRVLAAAINLDSIAAAVPVPGNVVTIYSQGYEEPFIVDLNNLEKQAAEEGSTSALVRGIAARLSELGFRIGGFEAVLSSDVLPGSGLSSSASIEVLIGTIFNHLFNDGRIEPQMLARVGQYAENEYFGKPCGLMDQMACAMGGIITIDFKNPAEPQVEKIDFDFAQRNYRMLVVDTGGSHDDLTADYAAIPAEMKTVAQYFDKTFCRDLSIDELLAHLKPLRSAVGDRAILRALHFLGENERVSEQVTALKTGDFSRFLSLITASGNSSFKWLQNIHSPGNHREQGVALALALSERYLEDIYDGACRVHGGGFAGTIQVFLPADKVDGYRNLIEPVFGEASVKVLQIRPYGTVSLNRSFIK
ncbi:MAG TPA: galactokinase [Caldithrix abyssi]|uniref:Galactokinase n=1 Tax=Caldithrix abyssi TaxID=187145 RepID=A0A7V4U2A5_CALAY|nr:galactokinase [Caldithrix abyssi]